MSKNWGYILTGKGRPPVATQRRVMAYAGCDMGEVGTVWQDAMAARTTRPQTALTERNHLIGAVQPGDVVHFAGLLCVGVSGPDVAWLLGELRQRGATVVIHEGVREVAPGDDPSEVVADFERARAALYARTTRAKSKNGGE